MSLCYSGNWGGPFVYRDDPFLVMAAHSVPVSLSSGNALGLVERPHAAGDKPRPCVNMAVARGVMHILRSVPSDAPVSVMRQYSRTPPGPYLSEYRIREQYLVIGHSQSLPASRHC